VTTLDAGAAALLPKSPLLITESADQFDCIRAALNHEIRPNGIIEHMYVADIAQLVWEILRLRRCKVSIINLAFRAAVEKLAAYLLRDPGVTTERQVAANRRNARRSTGPRSRGGKERASRNSHRHGLTAPPTTTQEHARRVENLARKIAADATDVVVLDYARAAAEAEFGIARVRQTKVALIERMFAFGELELPAPVDAAATMPSGEADRLTEAVRRALPELLKLDRYERRAAAVRERCLRELKNRIAGE
jgi:hypothetical protein